MRERFVYITTTIKINVGRILKLIHIFRAINRIVVAPNLTTKLSNCTIQVDINPSFVRRTVEIYTPVSIGTSVRLLTPSRKSQLTSSMRTTRIQTILSIIIRSFGAPTP